VPLEGAEEVLRLGQRQPKMLDGLVVLVEGDDIGDGLFVTVIVRDNELQFDAHSRASLGSSDECIAQVILIGVLKLPLASPCSHIVLGLFVNRYAFGRAVGKGSSPLLKHYHFDKTLPGVDKFTRSLNS